MLKIQFYKEYTLETKAEVSEEMNKFYKILLSGLPLKTARHKNVQCTPPLIDESDDVPYYYILLNLFTPDDTPDETFLEIPLDKVCGYVTRYFNKSPINLLKNLD